MQPQSNQFRFYLHVRNRSKWGPKSSLFDDVKLKLAQHISSELEIRHVLLIPRKRNKQTACGRGDAGSYNGILTPGVLSRRLSTNGFPNASQSILSGPGRRNYRPRRRTVDRKRVDRITCLIMHTNWPGCNNAAINEGDQSTP